MYLYSQPCATGPLRGSRMISLSLIHFGPTIGSMNSAGRLVRLPIDNEATQGIRYIPSACFSLCQLAYSRDSL